jgi:hypothetical protein
MIEMTITAQDPADLKAQIAALAVLLLAGTPVPETIPVVPAQEVIAKPKTPTKKHTPIKGGTLNGGLMSSQASDAQPGAPEPQGSAAQPGQVSPGEVALGSLPEPSPLTFDPKVVTPPEEIVVTQPKEMLELKQKVIDALQAAFRAGKVQKVRDVLANYGGGAKSFREIDAVAFPVIDKAIQSGALN